MVIYITKSIMKRIERYRNKLKKCKLNNEFRKFSTNSRRNKLDSFDELNLNAIFGHDNPARNNNRIRETNQYKNKNFMKHRPQNDEIKMQQMNLNSIFMNEVKPKIQEKPKSQTETLKSLKKEIKNFNTISNLEFKPRGALKRPSKAFFYMDMNKPQMDYIASERNLEELENYESFDESYLEKINMLDEMYYSDEFKQSKEKITKKPKLPSIMQIKKLSHSINVSPSTIISILNTKYQDKNLTFKEKYFISSDAIKVVVKDLNLDFDVEEKDTFDIASEIDYSKAVPRNPIICVLGHVDHGKTTLIDTLRNSSIASTEDGGITQSIGAFTLKINENEQLTIIDTPGHEAFTNMRKRGVNIVDCAILVVAANEGIKPTTLECIKLLRRDNVRFLIAITKCDLNAIDVGAIRKDLAKNDIFSDESGGDIAIVEVSSITGEGINELINLTYTEAMCTEPVAEPQGKATAIVLESKQSSQLGVGINVIVTNGVLKKNDYFVVDQFYGKVKILIDSANNTVNEAGPSTPVTIHGAPAIPTSGVVLSVVDGLSMARRISEHRQKKVEEDFFIDQYKIIEAKRLKEPQHKKSKNKNEKASLSIKVAKEREEIEKKKEIKFFFKADVFGSKETIINMINSIVSEDKEIIIRTCKVSVGNINKSDIVLSKALGAHLIGFRVGIDKDAEKIAKDYNVDINLFNVIYNLQDFVFERIKEKMDKKFENQLVGTALVKKLFPPPNDKKLKVASPIAGCEVLSGVAVRENDSNYALKREGKIIFEGNQKVFSLNHFKDKVTLVEEGKECGVCLGGTEDVKEGDVILFYRNVEVEKKVECVFSDLENK